ncbi:MAG: phosphatase PAP2 family protein [Aquificaceae bacterium]|jgi:membrane-associated phospholipid phosphatase|uniref:phosphatase PAP2 family protein n=1 Tax=Hydrogenobacter sp. Uz 6-8 TaxID=3384828 RepID=UPI000F0F72C4|nr:MAG: phosphatase PAP2 family protein [Aquificota bacterium]
MINIEKVPFNHQLFYIINHSRHPLLDVFYRYFYLLGKGWFGASVGLFLFILGDPRFMKYVLAMLLQALIVKALKYTVRAKRPSAVLEDVYLLEKLRLKSFPSGDSAMSITVALCLLKGSPLLLKPLLFAYPLLVGYGRVYMGAHFPLDVLAGWSIGALCFLMVCVMF